MLRFSSRESVPTTFREKMARITTQYFEQLRNISSSHAARILPFAKVSRSNHRNIFLRIFALFSTCGIIVYFINAAGSDNFVRNVVDEGIRIYSGTFESSNRLSDEATVTAVQFVENFLGDAPCEDSWRSQRCYKEVALFAKERQKRGIIVLAVTTAGKYEVALNWCTSMLRLGIENYMLVALDNESFQFFSDLGAPIVRLSGSQKTVMKNEVWVKRTLLTYIIVRAGVNVLVSDFDAVSVKSPFQSSLFRFEDPSFDIITTPSNFPNPSKNELPEECLRPALWWSKMEWRHQPCMGWTFFRSSPTMISFFEGKLLYDVIKFRDDQIGFNCAIRRAGAVWQDPQKRLKQNGMVTYSRSPKLAILMLPANRYVRTCTESKQKDQNQSERRAHHQGRAEMYHCKGTNKEASARSNGFWFLRDDWSSIRSESRVFNSYLIEIAPPLPRHIAHYHNVL